MISSEREYQQWLQNARLSVSKYLNLLNEWRVKYKPDNSIENIHPHFEERLLQIGYTEYIDEILLGYYDENYIYIIPDVFISRCNYLLNQHGLKAFNVKKILRNLYDLKLIKVYFNLSNGIRYRIQKRVGKTRKRYITFNRGEFEKIFKGGLL